MSLNHLAKDYFCRWSDSHPVLGPKLEGNYLSNILSTLLGKYIYFIKNDCSGFLCVCVCVGGGGEFA